MPLFNTLLGMGNPGLPFDRVNWPSKVDLIVSPKGIWLERNHTTSEVSLMGAARTSGKEPRPFIDDLESTFGIAITEENHVLRVTDSEKAKEKHKSYVEYLRGLPFASNDPAVKKLIEFLSNNPYETLTKTVEKMDINTILYEGTSAIRIVSTFGRKMCALAEQYAEQLSDVPTDIVRCAVTGEPGKKITFKYEKLSHMVGSSATGMVMASCNSDNIPVIRNYNFDNLDGSPISAQTYSTLLRNLQSLIDSKRNYIRIPNSLNDSYIIVYDNVADEIQAPVSSMLMDVYKAEDLVELGVMDEDIAAEPTMPAVAEITRFNPAEVIYKKYRAVRKGLFYSATVSGTVTCYRIHCVKARWSCTGEFSINVGDMCKNIDTWYKDTITMGHPHSIMNLLRSAMPKDSKVNSRDYESMMHTILFNAPIRKGIFERVITRIAFSGKRMSYSQYALVKACYNNSARHNNIKEFTDMLDTTRTEFAYSMGRLLAVGDYLQRKSNPTISTPISERLDARARSRPIECKNEVLKRIRKYCNQLLKNTSTRGVGIYGKRLVSDIVDKMDSAPESRLSTKEQAELSVGYIHQDADLYITNKSNKNQED